MLGADPEVFIFDEKGKSVPAWKYFPPKEARIESTSTWGNFGKGGFFRDGYALEFNVPPETCRARTGNFLRETMQQALTHLPRGYRLSTLATVRINRKAMVSAPPDCQIFGCDPSYNAYLEREFTVDLDAGTHPYRYAGGHLHTSHIQVKGEKAFIFAKLCDIFIGLPLAYLYDTPDEKLRRKFYGRAGEFRIQHYPGGKSGIEYRTPSPKVWNNHRLAIMFMGVLRSISYAFPNLYNKWDNKWDKTIEKAINTCNVPEHMLQTVPGFYTPELLVRLKRDQAFLKFEFLDNDQECHSAFSEYVRAKYGNLITSFLAGGPNSAAPITITPIQTTRVVS